MTLLYVREGDVVVILRHSTWFAQSLHWAPLSDCYSLVWRLMACFVSLLVFPFQRGDASTQLAISKQDFTRVSLLRQLQLLGARAWICYWRDTVYNTTRIVISGLWYLFLGGVFRHIVRNDFASVQVTLSPCY